MSQRRQGRFVQIVDDAYEEMLIDRVIRSGPHHQDSRRQERWERRVRRLTSAFFAAFRLMEVGDQLSFDALKPAGAARSAYYYEMSDRGLVLMEEQAS